MNPRTYDDLHYGVTQHPLRSGRCVAVLDTDHLINEVRDRTRGRFPPTIEKTSAVGSVRLFAAAHVFDEMYAPDAYGHANKFEKLAEQADVAGQATTADEFRWTFEQEFLPRIHFVDLPDDQQADPLVDAVAAQHASDVPTAQLAMLLGPAVVLSLDKHLRRPGVAPWDLHRVVKATHDAAAVHGALVGISFGAVAGISLIAYAVDRLAALLGLPRSVVVGVAAAAGLWVMSDPHRRGKAAAQGRRAAEGLGELGERGTEAEQVLAESAVSSSMPPTIEQRMAWALVNASGPLLATELIDRLERAPDIAATVSDVRKVLANHAAFCHPQRDRHRWQIGSRRVPPQIQ